MFDLEKAIRSWRRHLRREAFLNRAVLDELESHLRDAVDTLAQKGRTRKQAFEQAVQQLGDAASLRHEYSKLHSGRRWFFAVLRLMLVVPLTIVWMNTLHPLVEPYLQQPGMVSLDVIVVNFGFDILIRFGVYIACLFIAIWHRQWAWAGLFGILIPLPFIMDSNSSSLLIGPLPHWFGLLFELPLLLMPALSIFWIYPPPLAFEIRQRFAHA